MAGEPAPPSGDRVEPADGAIDQEPAPVRGAGISENNLKPSPDDAAAAATDEVRIGQEAQAVSKDENAPAQSINLVAAPAPAIDPSVAQQLEQPIISTEKETRVEQNGPAHAETETVLVWSSEPADMMVDSHEPQISVSDVRTDQETAASSAHLERDGTHPVHVADPVDQIHHASDEQRKSTEQSTLNNARTSDPDGMILDSYEPQLTASDVRTDQELAAIGAQHEVDGNHLAAGADLAHHVQSPAEEQAKSAEQLAHDSAGAAPSDNDLTQLENDSRNSLHAMSGFSIGLSVDSDISDLDSSLGDAIRPSSSVSVSSSVYEFVEEFGRTFHKYKQGNYVMPNDEQEQNRLDLQHAIMLHVLGTLAQAPVGSPQRVLDLGTGTGIWAIEYAEQNPASSVIGTDFSPIQPEYVPPNCRFEIDDAEDDWVWSYKFDYIHGRYFCPFLANVPKLLANAYEHLEPGGYLELQEAAFRFESVDDTLRGTPLEFWNRKMIEGMRTSGREPLIALQLKQLMIDAGFTDVQERRYAAPINQWPKGLEAKRLGAMEQQNVLQACHGISMNILTKVFKWKVEEVEVLLAKVRDNIRDRHIHAYFPIICVWGQKPLSA